MSRFAFHRSVRNWLALALVLAPCSAFAHTEEAATGFMAGLRHPVFGFDHLLAMVSVGVISSQLGGANIWRIPCIFVGAMIVGGCLGACGVPLPHSELGIAISVVALGLGIIFSDKTTPPYLVSVCVMFFGIFHGHAHGVEMPRAVEPVYYTFGFVTSTSLLHILGVIIGEVSIRRAPLSRVLRFAGGAMAACGMFFMLQAAGVA